jgi:hypothetical protein
MSMILVEVSGGLARVAINPTRAEVEVIDLDQLREGAYEDVHRYWNDSLSARARRHVRANYPEVARRLDA